MERVDHILDALSEILIWITGDHFGTFLDTLIQHFYQSILIGIVDSTEVVLDVERGEE